MAIRVRRQRNECISGLHKSKRMARPADNFPGFTVNRGKTVAVHDNAIFPRWSRNQILRVLRITGTGTAGCTPQITLECCPVQMRSIAISYVFRLTARPTGTFEK